MTDTINFANAVQAVLWEKNLRGQISDGMWENAKPSNHWQVWGSAAVKVNPGNTGRNFPAAKDNYDFSSTTLWKYVGEQLLEAAQTVNPEITDTEVRKELAEMKGIIRNITKIDDGEVASEPAAPVALLAPVKPAATEKPVKAAADPAKPAKERSVTTTDILRGVLSTGKEADIASPAGVELDVHYARVASVIAHTNDLKGKLSARIDRDAKVVKVIVRK